MTHLISTYTSIVLILQLPRLFRNKMNENISCIFDSIDNKGAIYISDISAAQSTHILNNHNINAVLTVARGGRLSYPNQHIINYLFIPAIDHEHYDLSQHFEQAYQFIEKHRRETNVLIHCMAGISRSVTIVAAYLMMKFNYPLKTVLKMIKRKRNQINPNPGFIKQLQLLQKSQYSSTLNRLSKMNLIPWKSSQLTRTDYETQQSKTQQKNHHQSKHQQNISQLNKMSCLQPQKVVKQTSSMKSSKIQLKIDKIKDNLRLHMNRSELGMEKPEKQNVQHLGSFEPFHHLLKSQFYKNKNKMNA